MRHGWVRFNVPPTHISHIGDGFYGSNDWSTVSKHWRKIGFQGLGFIPTRYTHRAHTYNNTTNIQCEKKTLNTNTETQNIYEQWNGPNVIKPDQENCKNCSSKVMCLWLCTTSVYTIQYRPVLIILPFTSRRPLDVVYWSLYYLF